MEPVSAAAECESMYAESSRRGLRRERASATATGMPRIQPRRVLPGRSLRATGSARSHGAARESAAAANAGIPERIWRISDARLWSEARAKYGAERPSRKRKIGAAAQANPAAKTRTRDALLRRRGGPSAGQPARRSRAPAAIQAAR